MSNETNSTNEASVALMRQPGVSDDLTIIEIDHERGEVFVESSGRPCSLKARFAPGMDARTKGTLQTAYRLGYAINCEGLIKDAEGWAQVYGYERFLTMKKVKPAKAAKTPKGKNVFGEGVTEVKAGRWWYPVVTIETVGEKSLVTYLKKDGSEGTVTVGINHATLKLR